ncbi:MULTISPECIES: hypothetical protein [Thalassobaculum]|nr:MULTISPECIES: hypothetical protein [Thalassobaculum]
MSTDNVIAQTPEFPRSGGLCAYGGGAISNDQLWYFLQEGDYLRIMSLAWLGTVIYSNGPAVSGYRTDDEVLKSPADQHWKCEVSAEYPDAIMITSVVSGRSILDPHSRGQTDSLEAQDLVQRDTRYLWILEPQA